MLDPGSLIAAANLHLVGIEPSPATQLRNGFGTVGVPQRAETTAMLPVR
jgi:hypothetical protein